MNPSSIMKLAAAKHKFETTHPKFMAFLQKLFAGGVQEGCVIEIKLTRPDGSELVGNMKVQESDLDLLRELKDLKA